MLGACSRVFDEFRGGLEGTWVECGVSRGTARCFVEHISTGVPVVFLRPMLRTPREWLIVADSITSDRTLGGASMIASSQTLPRSGIVDVVDFIEYDASNAVRGS